VTQSPTHPYLSRDEIDIHKDFIALKSGVDMITDCISEDFAAELRAKYGPKGRAHKQAVRLYALLDHLETLLLKSYVRTDHLHNSPEAA
jgi:hypothetical protein